MIYKWDKGFTFFMLKFSAQMFKPTYLRILKTGFSTNKTGYFSPDRAERVVMTDLVRITAVRGLKVVWKQFFTADGKNEFVFHSSWL